MSSPVTFHDYKPRHLSLYDAVINGLSSQRKAIPPKFFYDERGSQLFDAICEQPEYYLPDAEQDLLQACVGDIAKLAGQGRVVIEPGAGSMIKIRLLLDQLKPSAYVPMDISCEYLQWAAQDLSSAAPWLHIHAACVDFTHSMPIPEPVPDSKRLAFFPGSSLGNFHYNEAREFLAMLHNTLGDDGMLLIGVDTKKPQHILDAAYNDAAGVTAAFNLNLLQRIQRELDAECDPDAFTHQAFYNPDRGRVEMHLVSQHEQDVRVDGHRFHFASGETVHTECSYKYTPDEFLALAAEAGFKPVNHWLAREELFGVYLLAVK